MWNLDYFQQKQSLIHAFPSLERVYFIDAYVWLNVIIVFFFIFPKYVSKNEYLKILEIIFGYPIFVLIHEIFSYERKKFGRK